ncbi:MAG: hypothetical protein KGS72_02140 [Cyanobacteria bacterium REEB67]|nr:hypothetical protein [Cyanobacteria bacterium REEB67]
MTMLAKWIRKASSLFSEKPKVKVDDFGMEHFLLYHGLAGSSPENQREFKDVRADILSAISRTNSQNLCINMKLAPLWWEDKLRRIFDEAQSDSLDATIKTLLPEVSSGQDGRELDPLSHEDWRVRANAAAVIAFLGAHQAQERMIAALDNTAGGTKSNTTGSEPSPAFCHISRSLAGFRTAVARDAISKHLLNGEPWIRVDAVNAIAKWPLDEISGHLSSAFAEHHAFVDYASVALARSHSPYVMLTANDDRLADLGANVLVGLFEAMRGPFSSNPDLMPELLVHRCMEPLQAAATKQANPVKLRALSQLADWLQKNYHEYRLEAEGYPEPEAIAETAQHAARLISDLDIEKFVSDGLTESKADKNGQKIERSALRHAIKLAGEHKLKAVVPALTKALDDAPPYRDDIVEALGLIEDAGSAAVLIKLARAMVNIDDRTGLTLSANPIAEASPEKAKTYWYILRALGHLPGDDSIAFLLLAIQDEASDKREEALSSLIKLWSGSKGKLSRAADIKLAVQRAIGDPSAQVRTKALQGAGLINDASFVVPTAKLINAQEMSVVRAAFAALEQLAAGGHKTAIGTALAEIKGGLSNTIKIKRIDEFIKHHL